MTDPLFGVFIFIVAYFVGRVISERALRRLTSDEKVKLLDAFSSYRIYSMVIVLSLLFLFLAGDRLMPRLHSTLTPAFVALFVLALVTISYLSYRKLTILHMPTVYIKSFLVSTGVQYVGILGLFLPMVTRYFS